jgi:hypothetical protein
MAAEELTFMVWVRLSEGKANQVFRFFIVTGV